MDCVVENPAFSTKLSSRDDRLPQVDFEVVLNIVLIIFFQFEGNSHVVAS